MQVHMCSPFRDCVSRSKAAVGAAGDHKFENDKCECLHLRHPKSTGFQRPPKKTEFTDTRGLAGIGKKKTVQRG